MTTALRRAWDAPLPAHVAALALLLLVVIPVVGLQAEFSSDESAGIIQGRALAREGTWYLGHPFPEADPAGTAFPLPRSSRTEHGWSPMPKHPLYPLVLAVGDRAAGVAGMVVVSVVGTVCAAAAGALLARRLDHKLGTPALWTVGIATPLVVDSYLVMAHTVAAATAAGAVLFGLKAVRDRSNGALVAMAVAIALTALLRSEGVFLGVGLGGALAVIGLARRSPRVVLIGLAALAVTMATFFGESAIEEEIFGGGREIDVGSAPALGGDAAISGSGLFSGRIRGLTMSWLRPSYFTVNAGAVLSIALVLTGAAAALAARRHEVDQGKVAVLTAATAVLAAARLFVPAGEPDIVPGLLLAFPFLLWGLLLVRRDCLTRTECRLPLATWLLFAAAVLATQYEEGGAWEWGGRYFALGLPVIVPVLLHAGSSALDRLDVRPRRLGVAAVVVTSLSLAVIGVGAVRETHRLNRSLSDFVQATAARTDPGDGGTPVVLATELGLPRVSWRWLDEARWLFAEARAVRRVLDRLEDAGVGQVVLATLDGDRLGRRLDRAGWSPRTGTPPPAEDAWWIVTLERRPAT